MRPNRAAPFVRSRLFLHVGSAMQLVISILP